MAAIKMWNVKEHQYEPMVSIKIVECKEIEIRKVTAAVCVANFLYDNGFLLSS